MSEAFRTPGLRQASLTHLPAKTKITGFASPAADYECHRLSLDEVTGLGAPHIWPWRLHSEALAGLSLHANDTLIVNRQTELVEGRIAVVVLDNAHRVCLVQGKPGAFKLLTVDETGAVQPLEQTEQVEVWGVVDFVVRDLRAVRF
jgi:DNA polymerase V